MAKGIKINTESELLEAITKYDVPVHMVADINSRISDWLASGGNNDDEYIKNQFKYIEKYINSCRDNQLAK